MKIRWINPRLFENVTLINISEKALVYEGTKRETGHIFKFFKMDQYSIKDQKNLERKIKSAKPIAYVPEVLIPTHALYSETNGKFIGFQTDKVEGPHFREYIVDENESLDLYKFADEFSNLEDIISRGNEKGLVFPDIATLSNIMILRNRKEHLKENRKVFIDYDGIQVKKLYTLGISEGINPLLLHLAKYYKDQKKNLYSENLDYASILHMYCRIVFHIDLNYIGKRSEITKEIYTIDQIFKTIGLNDYDFMQKVWTLFEPNTKNEKVGDLFYKVADTYKIKSHIKGETEFRYLVKK